MQKREVGPIEIDAVYTGPYFGWGQNGIGFGQLRVIAVGDTLECDSECMGREWARKALYALADHIADHAKFDTDE